MPDRYGIEIKCQGSASCPHGGCPGCNAYGKTKEELENRTCPRCHGTGKSKTWDTFCGLCGGAGKIRLGGLL